MPEPRVPRSPALQQERPPQWEACALQLESGPRSPQLQKKRQQRQRPSTAKNLHQKKKGELRRRKTTLFAQHPAHKSGVSTARVDHSPCPQLWRKASKISPQRRGSKKWRAPQRQTALTFISVDRIQPPQINPHIYSQLISGRHARTIQWRKKSLFNKQC